MKQKTEAQRDKIIAAASELFTAHGFDAVSTADIAARMGGSKATLYNYFPSKESIFAAVMLHSAMAQKNKLFTALERDLPLPEKLTAFGFEYLQFALSQPMVDVQRSVLAQAGKIDIGPTVYEHGLKKAWQPVADLIAAAMVHKAMIVADPWLAAMQYKALLEANLKERRMLNVKVTITKPALRTAAEMAFAVFWAYYGRSKA